MSIDDSFACLEDASHRPAAWSPATIPHRLIEVAVAGALAAVLLNLVWLELRPDIAQAPTHALFWMKAFYSGGLALTALYATTVLTRPFGSVRVPLALGGALVMAVLIAAVLQAARMDAAPLARLLRPEGIAASLFNIVALAAPMLVLATLGLRRIDLERPIAMGLAAGLFCGGVATTAYGLHCPHETYVFVGLAYTAGIALCGGIGAGALVVARSLAPSGRSRGGGA